MPLDSGLSAGVEVRFCPFLEDSAMFTDKVQKLFRKTLGSRTMTPMRSKRSLNSRPRLEALEDRIVPAFDTWISTGSTSWDVGTNWSEMHSPAAGDTVVFANAPPNGSGSNVPCVIPAGDNLPTFGQLQVGAWLGTLTINSNLAANTVSIANRAGQNGSADIIINSGSNLYALKGLTWNGGSVSGSGNFEVGGGTINGIDATDKPTLGCRMDVGTSYLGTNYSGGLGFATSSQPLVVNSGADIYVNGGSSLTFGENSGNGSDMTAISNGDTLAHSIVLNGGTLNRTNYNQLFVATGLDVVSGQVNISNPQGQNTGNPLHFTGMNTDASGLEIDNGTLSIQGDLTSDNQGVFNGGLTTTSSTATLTLGVNANSPANLQEGGTLYLAGLLIPHGGFTINSGTFGTNGSVYSAVNLDAGNQFTLNGGELDVTEGGIGQGAVALGTLTINGVFTANSGTIVVTVDSDPNDTSNGSLTVNGNATLSTNVTFISKDLNPNPPANFTKNWPLMTVSGTLNGDFTYNLPAKWKSLGWSGGTLTIQENT